MSEWEEPEWEDVDPAKLAQMDREKAIWDELITGLVDEVRELNEVKNDSAKVFFSVMQQLAEVELWKVRAALVCAVQRLAELPPGATA